MNPLNSKRETNQRTMKPDRKLELTLCSGLPYGLKVIGDEGVHEVRGVVKNSKDNVCSGITIFPEDIMCHFDMQDFKPILRSIDHLTEDEKEMLRDLCDCDNDHEWVDHCIDLNWWGIDWGRAPAWVSDWLDERHFNRRGLDPDQYIDVNTLDHNCYE